MRHSSIRSLVVTGVLASGLAAFVAAQSAQSPPPAKPQDPEHNPRSSASRRTSSGSMPTPSRTASRCST